MLLFIVILITILSNLIAHKAGFPFFEWQLIKFAFFILGAIEIALDPQIL